MLFRTKLLVGCVAGFLASSVAFADSSVEFKGYARAGFDLNLSKFGREADAQGEQGLSTRHVRNLNYMQLWVTKNFENNSKFVLSVDSETFQNSYTEVNDLADADTGFRFRDAYYQTEITPDVAVWAGQRQFIFDEIRVLDILNNYNAFGVGVVIAKNTNVFISKANLTKLPVVVSLGEGYAKGKDLELVANSKIDLGTISVTPEVAVVRSAEVTQNGEKALGGKMAFTGRLLVGFTNDTLWNNFGVRFSQTPAYTCEGGTCDKTKVIQVEVTESGSIELGDFGVLVGGYLRYEKFDLDGDIFVNKDGEPKSGKSRVVASIDVQPVYYATDKFHLALDINKTFKTKYADSEEARDTSAALLITPIARYALTKNTIGQTQVYTSVTYGKYERDGAVFNGKEAKENLVTMQTGFELAF